MIPSKYLNYTCGLSDSGSNSSRTDTVVVSLSDTSKYILMIILNEIKTFIKNSRIETVIKILE